MLPVDGIGGGSFEGACAVTARRAGSAASFSAGCSELEYEQLLLAEAEVLASCGPELIDRLWARVIATEFARAPVVKLDHERDLTAMDLSVLVVEDNPFQQQAISAVLQIYSARHPSVTFRTKIVDSAVSAMAALQRRRDFHMVILDVVLPGVHGDELLPMIRQLLGDHVAVVAVSALDELSLVERCICRGADRFMVKPLQIQCVSQLWQQCMAKKRELLSVAATRAGSVPDSTPAGSEAVPAGSSPNSSFRARQRERHQERALAAATVSVPASPHALLARCCPAAAQLSTPPYPNAWGGRQRNSASLPATPSRPLSTPPSSSRPLAAGEGGGRHRTDAVAGSFVSGATRTASAEAREPRSLVRCLPTPAGMVVPSGGSSCARLCAGAGAAAAGGLPCENSAQFYPRRGMTARGPPRPASALYPPSCGSSESLAADDADPPSVPEALRPQDTPAWTSTGEVVGVSGCQHQ